VRLSVRSSHSIARCDSERTSNKALLDRRKSVSVCILSLTPILVRMADTLDDDYVADGMVAYSDDNESELEIDRGEQQEPAESQSSTSQATQTSKKRKRRELEKQRKVKVLVLYSVVILLLKLSTEA